MADDGDGDGDGDTDTDAGGVGRRPVRRGSVDIHTRDGDAVHHDEAAVRYEDAAFVVSRDGSFAPERTERYPKTDVAWIQVRHPRR